MDREKNQSINWSVSSEEREAYGRLLISLFCCSCNLNNIQYEKIRAPYIPAFYPQLVKEFYSKFAPAKRIVIKDIEIFPYALLLDFAERSQEMIAIGRMNGNPIYMDKYPNGIWDLRIQTPIGDGKVQILADNIFLFFGTFLTSYMDGEF